MQVRFEQGPDWLIEADLGPKFDGFNAAMHDAVSTMPPRGSSEECPSPYWIDRALEGLAQPPADLNRPLLQGNATALFTDGKIVRAHSNYDVFTDEVMALADFVDVLRQWRATVGAARREGRCGPAKELYARNPWPTRRPSA